MEGMKWCTSKASFDTQSKNLNGFNKMDGVLMADIHPVPPVVGAIVGFAVMGVFYVVVVIMIFIDMNKRK